MEMKLQKLKIRNFMGCKELDVDFAGENMKIYGDNATGKTTIMHAFNWLLFDKNAYGKSDFGIKPYDAAGEVIHRLETSVEGFFTVDDLPKQFKKVFREKWTRRKGSAEDEYTGNETEYYVNTVPKKKKEFTEEIARIIDENVFRMITNPLYFNENLDWKTRRAMLLEICGNISDEEVIASDRELEPLLGLLQGRTVDELKSMVSSQMKSINKELGILPSRIAEAELAKPTPRDDVDVSVLEWLEDERRARIQKKSDILNGAQILRLKAEMDNTRRELEKRRAEIWNKYSLDESRERNENTYKEVELQKKASILCNASIPDIDLQIESNKEKKKRLSDEWDEVFKQTFLDSKCPICNRELPEEQLAQKKREFNVKKAVRLDAIESELKQIKHMDNSLLYEKSTFLHELEHAQKELAALAARREEIDAIISAKEKEFEENKAMVLESLTNKLNDLRNEIAEQELNAGEMAKAVDVEIEEIERKIKPINDYLAEQNMIQKQENRIAELKKEQEFLSSKYTSLERELFLTEQFVRRKVSMIDDLVNKHFKYARFKLFDIQVNGGIAETCEVTFKGVPYRDLNTAGKINIGLDIINTLSTSNKVVAPIFVDNMESVTAPIGTLAQRIELIVSKQDKTLSFEKEVKNEV